MIELRSQSLPELEQLVASLGERPFRARQLFRWLHRRGADTLAQMTDLPQALRQKLEGAARIARLEIDVVQESSDGTLKYRLRTEDGKLLETVFMPTTEADGSAGRRAEAEGRSIEPRDGSAGRRAGAEGRSMESSSRRTLCVSTQVGCAMGCTFCRTATMGLVRDLVAGEIVGQVHAVERDLERRGFQGDREHGRVLTNLVFMGMGEPLHNLEHVLRSLELLCHPEGLQFSNRHVTVSTSGLVPEIERFGRETLVKLAISLNGTTDEQRERLMPVNRKYPLEKLLEVCRAFPQRQGRRLTFEYVLLSGVNDTDEDAERLARLVSDVGAKVNLIAYNENPGLGFGSPSPERVGAFRELLTRRGVVAVVRKNRGRDILGACGQLASASGRLAPGKPSSPDLVSLRSPE
ncbi:MAG: 23S rRNA (adenine(2503)-C(2))-methyltransferase RlmN [Deltaproteobacteria bacterium]